MMKRFIAAAIPLLFLAACGDPEKIYNRGEPVEVGRFHGKPIYYVEIHEPRNGFRRELIVIPGATVNYSLTVASAQEELKDAALSKLTNEEREALGFD